jgi:hypothetical protein
MPGALRRHQHRHQGAGNVGVLIRWIDCCSHMALSKTIKSGWWTAGEGKGVIPLEGKSSSVLAVKRDGSSFLF